MWSEIGFAGFSTNSYTELSALVFKIPKRLASSIGTVIVAIVRSTLFFVKFYHFSIVHFVNVISRKN